MTSIPLWATRAIAFITQNHKVTELAFFQDDNPRALSRSIKSQFTLTIWSETLMNNGMLNKKIINDVLLRKEQQSFALKKTDESFDMKRNDSVMHFNNRVSCNGFSSLHRRMQSSAIWALNDRFAFLCWMDWYVIDKPATCNEHSGELKQRITFAFTTKNFITIKCSLIETSKWSH